MPVGETRPAGVALREVAPSEAADAPLRHFDQLSHREQQAFLRLYRDEDPASVPLSAGEVIVFTGYYRVVG